jgi:hypothetical protein
MGAKPLCHQILIPWLSLPLLLLGYMALWDKVSPEIAVHFTPSGRTVTLMSRQEFLLSTMIILLVMLVVGSWKLWKLEGKGFARAMLRYYFAITAMLIIFFGIVVYNM